MRTFLVGVQIEPPAGGYPGRVEQAIYFLDNDTVVLCDQNGVPRISNDGRRVTATPEKVLNQNMLARLLRASLSYRSEYNFNKKLIYPRIGFDRFSD
jgi:hypothetical protein